MVKKINHQHRRGIILAGGVNSRLLPLTFAVAKSLLPVYDKPMIYYPLCSLMAAGIRDILIITAPQSRAAHRRLLGGGGQFGVRFAYATQAQPRGIADAFRIGRRFIGGAPCALALADNIFCGGDESELAGVWRRAAADDGACVFAYAVADAERFGVVEFDRSGRALSLEEKPAKPKSPYAVTGLYFYDSRVCDWAATMSPSPRGELEITDLNRLYLRQGDLKVMRLNKKTRWFDAGAPDSLARASDFVRRHQSRHGVIVAAPEEVAYRQGWITRRQLIAQTKTLGATDYAAHLTRILTTRR